MSLALLLEELAEHRIELRLEAGRLRFRAPEGALTAEWRERIGAHREELIQSLQGRASDEPDVLRTPASAILGNLWLFNQMQGPNCIYNIPLFLHLAGALDAAALRAALDDLVHRHQTLRCRFEYADSLMLEVRRDLDAPWEEEDLSHGKRDRLDASLREVAEHPFDLGQAPLMKARLIRLGPDEHVLALNFHHLVADGWSIGLILQELSAGYEARLAGHPADLPPLKWQYTDYVAWQERLRRDGTLEGDLAFWRQRLAGAPRCTTLPPDLPRPSVQSFEGSSVPLALEPATTARLRTRAREWGASLNHLTLAATAMLLAAFSGNRDLVLGLPLANRTRRELEPIIGMFVNVVPLRLLLAPDMSVRDLVAQVRQASGEALEHCHLPFERLTEELAGGRDSTMSPIYQVAYDFLPPLADGQAFGGLEVRSLELPSDLGISKYDCSFYLEEREGGVAGQIEYATSLYRRESAERWAQAFDTIVEGMLARPEATVGDCSAGLDPAENGWEGPVLPLPEASPWARFEDVALRTPDAVALEEGGRGFSYAELARMAGIVAAELAAHGVGKGDRVGLILPRGSGLVAAMLGVVRLGAVFVPFDRNQPRERLAGMAARARLRAAVGQAGDAAATGIASPLVLLDAGTWSRGQEPPPAGPCGLEDPLYMIFTSGSTGVPKAVEVPWRALCNLVQGFHRTHALVPGERVSQIASPSFDASLYEMWPTLLGGGTLVVVPEELKLDPRALRDWILRERIGLHFSPTPLAQALMALDWPADAPLRMLMAGGQALRSRPRPELPFRVWNDYGPTETGIVSTWGFVRPGMDPADLPDIGRPVDNTRIAILDEEGRRVPPGVDGELYIAGAGLALGYFDDPKTTAERFRPLPSEAHGTWYRTGDRVRMLPGGELAFLGRVDRQIKLRGYRIEPGEVECAVMGVQGVGQTAVRLEGERLVAYVEGDGSGRDLADLRQQAARKLPGYMLPSVFVRMDRLPRTLSGKIDLGAVPPFEGLPDVPSPPSASGTPAGNLEAAVSGLWTRLLGHPVPDADANFFDLGGHSLMLARLKELIQLELGREISVLDLYRRPTVARQAAFLRGQAEPEETAPRRSTDAKDIAIIGMAGRFPGADDVEAFWNNLCGGRDTISLFSREELLEAGVPPELADSPDYVPANGVLGGIDRFDAEFFGINAREAEILDPQQRLLLEEAWHAFEDAGYDPQRIRERVGVFVGTSLNGYMIENVLPHRDVVAGLGGFAVLIGSDKDFAATRISYKLDLRGPSLAVNTACSTSLVAIHQAVTALRDGQCELALAGGACVRARQVDGYRYEAEGILSRDGKCRAFDAEATGMVGGNGVALVLLKPLEAALADGDPVHAVIKGIAVNNDGADKVGFTAPSVSGLSTVIRDALARGGVDPRTVAYVEAHGTGTRLGDSIEVAALAEAYAPGGSRPAPLRLGSVKTNVGHLDAAAGAAGLIKAALCLRERTLVPSLHFRTPSPEIPWPGDCFRVCTRTEPFGADGAPLRAAVDALGLGGTNAHAVLEQAPARPVAGEEPAGPFPLLVSGRSAQAFAANAGALAGWLERHPEASLADTAHTLAFGRRAWKHRRVVCAGTAAEAAALLAESPLAVDEAQSVAFLFTGMGQLKPGEGRALYGTAPVFTASVDQCADLLQPALGLDIRDVLLAEADSASALALLADQRVGQPVLFALEYALARFWMDLGITPSVLIGHSFGEWVAACLAGVFELPDALRLVTLRGALADGLRGGAMTVVNLGEAEVAARLPGGLDIALVNALDQTVVAGPAETVAAFTAALEGDGIRCKQVPLATAFHSSLLDPVLDRFRAAVAATPRHAPDPAMAVVSNVTGDYLDAESLQSPDYWAGHLRRCVRFADGLATLWARPALALLECGPSHALCNLALRDPRRPDGRAILASLDGEADPGLEWRRILESAGTLWSAGLPLDLGRLFSLLGQGRRISLPGYAFQRKRYWLDAADLPSAAPRPPCAEEPEAFRAAAKDASPAEARVIAIMHELLGPAPISRTSDFFLSGGDSLLAIRLTSRLGETFGVQPTQAEVMRARTPANIAVLLAGRATPEAPPSGDEGCLVRLQTGDERLAPIVLIHAVGGGVFTYRELLQALATAHPVYGLQAPGLWDDSGPINGLRRQAEVYHASLLKAGVARPLMIGGSSYGGLVAYELDRLYRDSGHRAPLVALFDSPGPGHMPARFESEPEVCAYMLTYENGHRDFAADVERLRALDHEGRIALLVDHLGRTVLPRISAEFVERLLKVLTQNFRNMWDWTPRPHEASLCYFKATEPAEQIAADPELAWVPLAKAGIEILPVPGGHASMLSYPHVETLARELKIRLSRLQA